MTDEPRKPEKPKPTYEQLAAENAALRAKVARLEAAVGQPREEPKPKPSRLRTLDPESPSSFGRPYDGR